MTGFLFARQGFSGNRALIHTRYAGKDNTISRYALAGTYQNDVAFDERTSVHLALFAVLHEACKPRHLLDEFVDGG